MHCYSTHGGLIRWLIFASFRLFYRFRLGQENADPTEGRKTRLASSKEYTNDILSRGLLYQPPIAALNFHVTESHNFITVTVQRAFELKALESWRSVAYLYSNIFEWKL